MFWVSLPFAAEIMKYIGSGDWILGPAIGERIRLLAPMRTNIAFKWPNGQVMDWGGFEILGMPRSSKHFQMAGSKDFKRWRGSIWTIHDNYILYCSYQQSGSLWRKTLWKAPRPKTSHWGSSCGWTTCRGTVPKHRCSRRRLEMVRSSHCGWLGEDRPDRQRCFNVRDYVAAVQSHSPHVQKIQTIIAGCFGRCRFGERLSILWWCWLLILVIVETESICL